jgi:hypothetical protein
MKTTQVEATGGVFHVAVGDRKARDVGGASVEGTRSGWGASGKKMSARTGASRAPT